MREALAEHPLALAYCDMRVIDGQGKFRSVYRRGAFDAPRLFSSDTLGVPFAATTALAKDIGGFSVRDYADDVRFCVEAYGIANFVYVPEALMDYRLHGGSRTAAAGGDDQMSKLFTMLMPKVFAALEKRGVQPRVALERAIRQGLEEFDLFVADIWYRKFSHWVRPWWVGEPRFEHFFLAGLLGIPGLSQACQPPKRLRIHDADGRSTVGLPKVLLMRWYLRKRGQTRVLRHLAKRLRNMLVTWAAASISTNTDESVTFRIRSLDFRTLWVACELAAALRWTPLLDTAVKDAPAWLNWGQARGDEPLLDCAFEVSLGREK
jgi:hypothetical protein